MFLMKFARVNWEIDQVIGDKKYYGSLRGVDGVEEAVLRKQLDSLETILLSINKIL